MLIFLMFGYLIGFRLVIWILLDIIVVWDMILCNLLKDLFISDIGYKCVLYLLYNICKDKIGIVLGVD